MVEGEEVNMRVLQEKEKVWGLEHTSTLNTVDNLGDLCTNQGKIAEAEEMYIRGLVGHAKALGPNRTTAF